MEYLNESSHHRRRASQKPLGSFLNDTSVHTRRSSLGTRSIFSTRDDKSSCSADLQSLVHELQDIFSMDCEDIAIYGDGEVYSFHREDSSHGDNGDQQPQQHPCGLALVPFSDSPKPKCDQRVQNVPEHVGQGLDESHRTHRTQPLHEDEEKAIKKAEFGALRALLERCKDDLSHATDHISWMEDREVSGHNGNNSNHDHHHVYEEEQADSKKSTSSTSVDSSEHSALSNAQADVETHEDVLVADIQDLKKQLDRAQAIANKVPELELELDNQWLKSHDERERMTEARKALENRLEECKCKLSEKDAVIESLRDVESENVVLSDHVKDLSEQLEQKEREILSLGNMASENSQLNGIVQDLVQQLRHMDDKNATLTRKLEEKERKLETLEKPDALATLMPKTSNKATDSEKKAKKTKKNWSLVFCGMRKSVDNNVRDASDREDEKWLAVAEEKDAEIKRRSTELEGRFHDTFVAFEAIDYDPWREENEVLKKSLEELKDTNADALQSESRRLREAELRLEQNDATIKELRLQLEQSTAQADLASRLEEANCQLCADIDVLANKLANKDTDGAQQERVKLHVRTNGHSEKKELEAQIDCLQTDLSNSVEANAHLEEHVSALEYKMSMVQKKYDLLERQAKVITEEAATLINDVAGLEERLHEVELENEKLHDSNNEMRNKLVEAERKTHPLTQELESLNSELRFAQAKLSDVCGELNDRNTVELRIQDLEELLEDKNCDLKMIETKHKQLAKDLEAKRAKLNTLEKDCGNKQLNLEKLERDFEIKTKLMDELTFSWHDSDDSDENVKVLQANYERVVLRATDLSIELADCHAKVDALSEEAKLAKQKANELSSPPINTENYPETGSSGGGVGGMLLAGMSALYSSPRKPHRKKAVIPTEVAPRAFSPPKRISSRRMPVGRSVSSMSLMSISEEVGTEDSSTSSTTSTSSDGW